MASRNAATASTSRPLSRRALPRLLCASAKSFLRRMASRNTTRAGRQRFGHSPGIRVFPAEDVAQLVLHDCGQIDAVPFAVVAGGGGRAFVVRRRINKPAPSDGVGVE